MGRTKTILIDSDLHRKLKVFAAEKGKHVREVAEQIIKDFLDKNRTEELSVRKKRL